jgi:hypothetical protein
MDEKDKVIIMVSGNGPGAGKDTFYELFRKLRKHALRVSFADPLKEYARTLCGWDGIKNNQGRQLLINIGQIMRDEIVEFESVNDRRIYYNIRNDDYVNFKYNKYTIREIYDMLTSLYEPDNDYWVNLALTQIKESNYKVSVITDWRFENEYDKIKKEFEGLVFTVRVNRPNVISINDISEKDLDKFKFDFCFDNKYNKGYYQTQIQLKMENIFKFL